MRRTPPRRRLATAALVALAALAPAQSAAPWGPGSEPDRLPSVDPGDRWAVTTRAVAPGAAAGFGGGTLYLPSRDGADPRGAVIMAPGYFAPGAQLAWLADALCARGYAVVTVDTRSPLDLPDARGEELLAAADYLSSLPATREDSRRTVLLGYSSGAGGALRASEARHDLGGVVALMPADTTSSYPGDTAPTLVVSAHDDVIAPEVVDAGPILDALPAATPRRHVALPHEGHFAAMAPNRRILAAVVSFLSGLPG